MRAKLIAIPGCLALLTAAIAVTGQTNDSAPKMGGDSPALALVILYDGSGSMRDKVPNVRGEPTPKYQLANNAVITIAQKAQDYCTNKHVTIDAGLVYFTDAKVKVGIPLQAFDLNAFQNWAKSFNSPDGGTPLGEGIKAANRMLAKSRAVKKHILIVTDGEQPGPVAAKCAEADESAAGFNLGLLCRLRRFGPGVQSGQEPRGHGGQRLR